MDGDVVDVVEVATLPVPDAPTNHPLTTAVLTVGAVAGVGLLVLGTAGMTDVTAWPRWVVSIAGVMLFWISGSRLVTSIWGPGIDVGLWAAAIWVVVLAGLALLAPLLPFEGPLDLPLRTPTYLRPDLFSEHPLGTDGFGRDFVSRLVYGARVSLVVGLGGTLVALLIGTPIGIAAGYFRGRFDGVVSVLTDSLLAFPPLVFLLALVAVLRPSLSTIFVAFSILGVPTIVRLARANTMTLAQREYVIAAQAAGARPARILFRELLPNLTVPLLSFSMVIVAALILGEASLSFLGLGIEAPQPSWGNMIAEAQTVLTEHPHAILVPAFTLFFTVVAFNRLGEAARRRWDTRTSAL